MTSLCAGLSYYEETSLGGTFTFEWKMTICSKTFTVAFVLTYIVDQKSNDSHEKI